MASSGPFPAASNTATPPTQFHVIDVAANSEIIAVTNVSGTTWTVTRGAENTTPVTHAAGFSVFQVTTAGWLNTAGRYPFLRLSPTGLANGAPVANNGADYGPDTAGTTTCGIQEALNSLPPVTLYDGGNNSVSGQSGFLFLARGVFQTSGPITIPAGQITIQGCGASSWIPIQNIASPTADIGGTAIVGSDTAHSVITCPQDAHSVPATVLNLRDLDIRLAGPASAQTSSAPDILDLAGHLGGEVRNVNVLEVASGGGIGHNMYVVADFDAGASKDDVALVNVRGYGGHTGIRVSQAHVTGINLSGGATGTGIDNFDRGLDIQQNIGCQFINLHCFSSTYGLSFFPYGFGQPWTPQVIRGVHFEAVTHYVLADANSVTGTLILDMPIWDQASPGPAADVASVLAGESATPSISAQTGLAVITRNELDPHPVTGNRHVTVPKGAWTAGTSPYTFTALPYDCVFVITTTGGMTALTLDGQALFNGSFSIGQQVYVGAGHSLIATWATTAPVFEVLPL